MIEDLLRESFARHERDAPNTQELRRAIDTLATRRRRRRAALLTAGVGATVAMVLVAVTVAVRQLAPVVGNLPATGLPGPVADRALNILLIGLDPRPEEPYADLLNVVHVSSDRRHVYLVDFPRDLLIDVPGHGPAKLSDASVLGGPQLTATVVEHTSGLELDGTVSITVDALRRVTDALGPVPVCLPHFLSITGDGRTFPAGCQEFDADDVVAVARERYNVPMAAIGRSANVQRIMVGLAGRAQSLDLLSDAGRIASLLSIDGITIDLPGIDPIALAAQLRGVAAGEIVGIRDPEPPIGQQELRYGEQVVGAVVVLPDPEVTPQLYAALRDGTLADFVSAHPDWVSTG